MGGAAGGVVGRGTGVTFGYMNWWLGILLYRPTNVRFDT
jgi:hypothetical protein